MGELATLVVRRLASGVLVIWIVATLIFFFMRFAGDPIMLLAGDDATVERIAFLREQYGFNRPVYVQYLDYLGGVVTGNFGESFRYNLPALPLVLERLPATLKLAGTALGISIVVALPVGILSALRPGSLIDTASRGFAVTVQAMPSFWLGILLILLFAVRLGVLPSSGRGTLQHMILPSCTLAVYALPVMMRLARSSMLDVLGQEYVKTARAKGLPERAVIMRHALRNAIIPVITVIALRAGFLLTGSVVVEEVFGYPGIGRLAISSLQTMDYFVVQAFIVVVAGLVILANFVADVLYGLVDPRIRVG